jgi:hypothetical protein
LTLGAIIRRAYPKTDRGGDSGDFEFGQEVTTMADQSAIRQGVTTPPKLKIPLSRRVSPNTCRLPRQE